MTFLEESYKFYKELFWDGINGKHFTYAHDSGTNIRFEEYSRFLTLVLCLNKMAEILGHPEDAVHWNETVGMDNLMRVFENGWEKETPGMYGTTSGGIGWSNVAPAANSQFPRDWLKIMAEEWLDDSVKGFFGDIALTRVALQDWDESEIDNFAVVPGDLNIDPKALS